MLFDWRPADMSSDDVRRYHKVLSARLWERCAPALSSAAFDNQLESIYTKTVVLTTRPHSWPLVGKSCLCEATGAGQWRIRVILVPTNPLTPSPASSICIKLPRLSVCLRDFSKRADRFVGKPCLCDGTCKGVLWVPSNPFAPKIQPPSIML